MVDVDIDTENGGMMGQGRIIPGSLDYSQLPNRAINHDYIAMTLYPTGSYSQLADTVIRFKFRMDDNLFWDPYSAYLRIDISFDENYFNEKAGHQIYSMDVTDVGLDLAQNVNAVKFIQLDSSATNMIAEYIAYDQNVQLYRLIGLDILHTMLKDLNYGSSDRLSKIYEGYGGIKTAHLNHAKVTGRGFINGPLDYPTTMSGLHTTGGPFGTYNQVSVNLGWNPNGRPVNQVGYFPGPVVPPQSVTGPKVNIALGDNYTAVDPTVPSWWIPSSGTVSFLGAPCTAATITNATNAGIEYQTVPYYNMQQNVGSCVSQATINVFELINPDFISGGIFDFGTGKPVATSFPSKADVLFNPETIYENYFGNNLQMYRDWDTLVGNFCSFPDAIDNVNAGQVEFEPAAESIYSQISAFLTDDQFYGACYFSIYGANQACVNYMSLDQNGFLASLSSYPLPFNETFSSASFEHIFSKTPLMSIIQGQTGFSQRLQHRFIIPLPCVIWGCYTPPERYKLVPMKAFKDPWIEMRFTKDAFFTSWWTANLDYRRYKVDMIDLRCEMAQFYDRNIDLAMQALLATGITINTTAWQMALMQNIPAGAIPSNVQINVGFDSLRKILFAFLSLDYLTFASSRKQWRVNQSLSSYYVKIGTKYIPSQPIQGSASTLYGQSNCLQFYYETLKAFNKHLSRSCDQAFNPFSFAWQYRPYFTKNTIDYKQEKGLPGILYPISKSIAGWSSSLDLYSYIFGLEGTTGAGPLVAQWGDLVVENFLYTGTGQKCYYYENAFVGKAMYALDLDSLNYENFLMSGISTVAARPFDLIFTVDQNAKNKFPRATMLWVFGCYDLSIVLTPNATLVFGLT